MKAGMAAQRARVETEAHKLAYSGEYAGWRSIERALLAQKRFTRVSYVFANFWTRSKLDQLCQRAQLRRKERALTRSS